MIINSNGLIGSFQINGKNINFPAYFPQIGRIYDLNDLLNVIRKLESAGDKKPLQNTRGIFIEIQKCPKILETQILSRNQQRLFDREKGSSFSSFYEFRKEYGIPLFIDPNLDRITAGGYVDDFKKMKDKIFPKEFSPFIKGKTRDIKSDWLLNLDFTRRVFEYQLRFLVDELISPYIAINYRQFDVTLGLNKQLYKKSLDIAKTIFNRDTKPLPIICIKKNVLKARTGKDGKNPIWERIISFYNSTGVNLLILKLSDFNTHNKDEPYEQLCDFFKYVRQRVKDPIILLNVSEFAYILFGEGLQIYSAMMSRTGMESGGGGLLPDEDRKENMFGKYYVPRTMELAKRRDLKTLKCDGLMCKPFAKGGFKKLNQNEWNTLRIGHFLITKNNEIEYIKDEIKKDGLRAALKDMFADSKNWKNFTQFC